jgi:uncharacterized protein (TIGR02996 family)
MTRYTGPDADFAHPPEWEQAILAAPTDAGLRLVYADWLDDRGLAQRAARQRAMARTIGTGYLPIDLPWQLPGARAVSINLVDRMVWPSMVAIIQDSVIFIDIDGHVLDGLHKLEAKKRLGEKRTRVTTILKSDVRRYGLQGI